MLDKICLILVIIGALNWGSVGLFQFNIVSWLFDGNSSILGSSIISRIIYTIIALAGIWCISLLFRKDAVEVDA